MLTPKKTISATDAARNLSDLLNRIHYQGERYIIVRNGIEVAELSPPSSKGGSIGEFLRRLDEIEPLDSEFGEDLAEIRASQPRIGEARRDS